jgi:hypothetical protein
MYGTIKTATTVFPSEMHPPWSSVFKYPIGDLLKTRHYGIRPSRHPKLYVLRQIEEIYSKLSKFKPKKLFELIKTEKTFSKYLYDQYTPTDPNQSYSAFEDGTPSHSVSHLSVSKTDAKQTAGLKQGEKSLVNFIHSVDSFKDENGTAGLFTKLLTGILPAEAFAFLLDVRRFVEEHSGHTMLQLLEKKVSLGEVYIPYRNLKKILDSIFGAGHINSTNEFLEKVKEEFPEMVQTYNVPYERFIFFCVEQFCNARGSYNKTKNLENTIDVHPFKEKFEDYKYKTKTAPDIKIYDRLLKLGRRKMKTIVPDFINLITVNCDIKDHEEFNDFKILIKDLLLNKCIGLMESIVANNREMWFSLLTIDVPGAADLEYLTEVVKAWSELVRDMDKHQKLGKKAEQGDAFMNSDVEVAALQDFKIENFCKMMVTNTKMTQEICRLIIYLTGKDM